jgi:hypothetical protein
MPAKKPVLPPRVKPSTCKGVYGFSYEWFTHTKSPAVINILHGHARERAEQCMRECYVAGELVYESPRGRIYTGWWRIIKKEDLNAST